MNDPKRPFPTDVKSQAERWREETFAPAAAAHPERKNFVTDVGIGDRAALHAGAISSASASTICAISAFPANTRSRAATVRA